MLSASQFELATVQVSIWTPAQEVFPQSKILLTLLTAFSDTYDGPPQSVVPPDGAPIEFPRIVLRSSDNTWQLRANPTRIDAHWICPVEADAPDNVIETCAAPLMLLTQELRLSIARIAVVLSQFCEAVEPSRELIRRFTNTEAQHGPFRNSSSFEIHNHKVYQLPASSIRVNSWVRCRTGTIQPSLAQAVTVDQDLNTLVEEVDPRVYSLGDFQQFVTEAKPEMREILELYFPEGE